MQRLTDLARAFQHKSGRAQDSYRAAGRKVAELTALNRVLGRLVPLGSKPFDPQCRAKKGQP